VRYPFHLIARREHTSVVLTDGSMLVMGGALTSGVYLNDVWKSVDGGTTWTLVTANAQWPGKTAYFYRV